ncbi:MAG: hypothetical protein PHH04_03695 [Thomasclavelia sp.]|jgi:hypothetical protein|nr:hypothetical protein [Thomasclavelia sp.]
MSKFIKIILVVVCVFTLGGCKKKVETVREKTNRMIKETKQYMEDKYDEEFTVTDYERKESMFNSDNAVYFCPKDDETTMITAIYEEDSNHKVKITDNYLTYKLGNDCWKYFNEEIRKIYPRTLTQAGIDVLDNKSAHRSFQEVLEKSKYDLTLIIYIDETSDTLENIKTKLFGYAKEVYDKYKMKSIYLGFYLLSSKGIDDYIAVDNEYSNRSYYDKDEKIESMFGSSDYPECDSEQKYDIELPKSNTDGK